VTEDGAAAIAGARDVLDTAAALTTGVPSPPADLGISVQPLTSRLMTALGVQRGVVISDVAAGAPADGKLQPADVITGVDDWSTNDPDELLMRFSAQRPGVTVTIAFVRNHQPRTVAITLPGDNTSRAAQSLRLSIEPGIGTRIDASGEAEDALAAGDVITRAGSIDAPTPRQVRAILSQPGFAILVVRRDWRQRVVAVPVTAAVDAAIR
jgi:S1-C subfamily serine protease